MSTVEGFCFAETLWAGEGYGITVVQHDSDGTRFEVSVYRAGIEVIPPETYTSEGKAWRMATWMLMQIANECLEWRRHHLSTDV